MKTNKSKLKKQGGNFLYKWYFSYHNIEFKIPFEIKILT